MKFHEMTSPAIAAVDREKTLVVVPIAAVEQHGPHLPTGTDTIICTAIVERLEAEFPENSLVLPTTWLGASAHHMRFGATVTAELDTYIATLCEIGISLLEDGFRRILFVNGHGGNVDPLQVALRQLQSQFSDALLAGGSYWNVASDLLQEVLNGDHKFVGHACEFETSVILHLRPELVDRAKMADAGELVPNQISNLFVSRDMRHRTAAGCTGRPDLASAEKGEKLFEGIISRLSTAANELLAAPLGVTYEDFV